MKIEIINHSVGYVQYNRLYLNIGTNNEGFYTLKQKRNARKKYNKYYIGDLILYVEFKKNEIVIDTNSKIKTKKCDKLRFNKKRTKYRYSEKGLKVVKTNINNTNFYETKKGNYKINLFFDGYLFIDFGKENIDYSKRHRELC